MICKYYLTIGGVKSEIGRPDFRNWNEVEYSIKRSDFSGVVRSFTSSFEFVGDTADKLTDEYESNGLYSSAEIEVCEQQNDFSFSPIFACPLNFSTYRNNGEYVSIGSIDNSLESIIKANKGKKYEFLMSDMITESGRRESVSVPFDYEGMDLSNVISYGVGIWDSDALVSEFVLSADANQKIPMYMKNEYVVDQSGMEWEDQTHEVFRILSDDELKSRGAIYGQGYQFPYGADTNGTNCFLINTSRKNMRVFVDMELYMELPPGLTTADFDVYVSTAIGWESNETHDGNIYHLENWGEVQYQKAEWVPGTTKLVMKDKSFTMYPGYKLMLLARLKKIGRVKIKMTSCKFDAIWKTKSPKGHIDYVRPSTLLDKIVGKMTEGRGEGYSAAIEVTNTEIDPYDFTKIGDSRYDSRISHTILVPIDAISQNPDSVRYIKTTFSDFCQWMEVVFGYVYVIEGKRIVFRHRDKVFGKEVSKIIDSISDPVYKVEKKNVYSNIEIGYKGKEDGYNSKYEFNRDYVYDTGIANTEKKLTLLSPYRADSVGFETAYQKGWRTINDEKSSEEGIWCVYMDDTDGYGNRKNPINVLKPRYIDSTFKNYGLFNLHLSPVYCLKANSRYISSFTDRLELITEDINDVLFFVDFGNLSLKRDFLKSSDDCGFFTSPFVSVGEFSFHTNDISVPEDMSGLVKVKWMERYLYGYIKTLKNKYELVEQSDYVLIVKYVKTV